MVISVFSSEVVLPSGESRLNREFTVRAVAPCGDISQRFSKRCELNTEKYKRFAAHAKQAIEIQNVQEVHADIFASVRHGNRVRTEQLIKEDDSIVNCRDQYGNTPLIIAAQNNQLDIAELLVLKKADVDARNSKGNTALHFACKYHYHEMKRRLVEEWNANPSIRNTRWLLCANDDNLV